MAVVVLINGGSGLVMAMVQYNRLNIGDFWDDCGDFLVDCGDL